MGYQFSLTNRFLPQPSILCIIYMTLFALPVSDDRGNTLLASRARLQFELRLNLRLSYLALWPPEINVKRQCRRFVRRKTSCWDEILNDNIDGDWAHILLCLSYTHLSYFSNHTYSNGDLMPKRSSSGLKEDAANQDPRKRPTWVPLNTISALSFSINHFRM